MPASSHITHLNTARNSQTKKPSVTLSAAMRNLPSLFIDVTPIFLNLAGALVGALFLLFREQPRQILRHARNLRAAGMPSAGASARQSSQIAVFKRRLDEGVLRQASAIVTIYLLAVIVSTLTICTIDPFSMKQVLFEVVSAVGTVGLSLGITPSLSMASKIIIMILMFAGRVGGLSFALIIAQKKTVVPINRPTEKVMIG